MESIKAIGADNFSIGEWWGHLANQPVSFQLVIPGREERILEVQIGESLGGVLDRIEELLEEEITPPGNYGEGWVLVPDNSSESFLVCSVTRRLPASFFFVIERKWRVDLQAS